MTEPQTDSVRDEDDYEDDDYAPEPPRSGWAVAALVLGLIAALTPLGKALGIVAILAIIAGHSARRDVKRGVASGKTMAAWGLGLGYFALAITFLINLMNNF